MTSALATALKAVNRQVPAMVEMLQSGTLPVGKQRDFAALLIGLGELLKEYADAADRVAVR